MGPWLGWRLSGGAGVTVSLPDHSFFGSFSFQLTQTMPISSGLLPRGSSLFHGAAQIIYNTVSRTFPCPLKTTLLSSCLSGPNAPRHFANPAPYSNKSQTSMAELECKISHFQTHLSSGAILQFGSTDKYLSVFIFLFCVALCGLNMTFTNVLPPARQVIASLFHTNGDRESSPG